MKDIKFCGLPKEEKCYHRNGKNECCVDVPIATECPHQVEKQLLEENKWDSNEKI